MSIRIKAKQKGDAVEVKLIAKHPMDSGQAKDKDGNPIPAHYIETLEAKVGGETVFVAALGPAVSKDPYLKFYYAGSKGDEVEISWRDNKNETTSATATVK